MKIDVSQEIADEIRRLCGMLRIGEDELLRKLLQLPAAHAHGRSGGEKDSGPHGAEEGSVGLISRDGHRLAVGTVLYAQYMGQEHRAEVVRGGLRVNGELFTALSPAANSITDTSVNGKTFWGIKDKDGELVSLKKLWEDGKR